MAVPKGRLKAQVDDELRTLYVDPAAYQARHKQCLTGAFVRWSAPARHDAVT
jgi:hypothetical protein